MTRHFRSRAGWLRELVERGAGPLPMSGCPCGCQSGMSHARGRDHGGGRECRAKTGWWPRSRELRCSCSPQTTSTLWVWAGLGNRWSRFLEISRALKAPALLRHTGTSLIVISKHAASETLLQQERPVAASGLRHASHVVLSGTTTVDASGLSLIWRKASKHRGQASLVAPVAISPEGKSAWSRVAPSCAREAAALALRRQRGMSAAHSPSSR